MTANTCHKMNWYLLGVKMNWSHTHKTRLWYLLEVPFRISNDHPVTFVWESPMLTRLCLSLISTLQISRVRLSEGRKFSPRLNVLNSRLSAARHIKFESLLTERYNNCFISLNWSLYILTCRVTMHPFACLHVRLFSFNKDVNAV